MKILAPIAALACFALPSQAAQDDRTTDELLIALQDEYGTKSKKYDSLAKSIAKAIDKELKATVWLDATGAESVLTEHPYFAFLEELSETAGELSKKRISAHARDVLRRFPWDEELELKQGLAFGADREVPANENGFIHLGRARGATPGYPDFRPNVYLYGVRDVVSWRYGVGKKKATFAGRTSKNGPVAMAELPGWEALRIYLEGSVPDVSLEAISALTHRMHARLADRRAADSEGPARMDECLAFFDSQWNGFTFEPAWDKKRVAFVQPAHFLLTDTRGFVQSFPRGKQLAGEGNAPFFCILANVAFAEVFQEKKLKPRDIIQLTPDGAEAEHEFTATMTYLARYKTLIDLFVRAILEPNLRYPSYMSAFDYAEGRVPGTRELSADYDQPRKHALLIWAATGGNPEAAADYLYDELLSIEQNLFPADVSLPVQLTLHVRENESELVARVAERVTEAPTSAFGREFSPHATHLDTETRTASDYVAHSHATYHAPIASTIRRIARAMVEKELD